MKVQCEYSTPAPIAFIKVILSSIITSTSDIKRWDTQFITINLCKLAKFLLTPPPPFQCWIFLTTEQPETC